MRSAHRRPLEGQVLPLHQRRRSALDLAQYNPDAWRRPHFSNARLLARVNGRDHRRPIELFLRRPAPLR